MIVLSVTVGKLYTRGEVVYKYYVVRGQIWQTTFPRGTDNESTMMIVIIRTDGKYCQIGNFCGSNSSRRVTFSIFRRFLISRIRCCCFYFRGSYRFSAKSENVHFDSSLLYFPDRIVFHYTNYHNSGDRSWG